MNNSKKSNAELLTFDGHLEVLRQMLFRVLGVTLMLATAIFCLKDVVFRLLLAPTTSNFCTYRVLQRLLAQCGLDVRFAPFQVQLINTELSSQFTIHFSTSIYLALLFASPYILWELYRFVSPALYANERRYSLPVLVAMFILFLVGVAMNYFVLFPFAVRFLGTYQVASMVVNQINLSSYISTFITLTLLMGLVFQVPIISVLLAKMGLLTANFMRTYRRHALIVIMLLAAIITPPDIFTMLLVAVPVYLLYELSIGLVSRVGR